MRVARRLLRSLNVFRRLHHRHNHHRILRKPHLRSAGRIRANRLYPKPVRQDGMMPDLIHRPCRQLHSRRKLSNLVAQVGEADEFIRRHPMVHLVAEMLRHIGAIIRKRL